MGRPPQPSDLRLLSKVSKLYYEQGLTQQAISGRLHLSRPKVSRLLQEAADRGIVQITVHSPPGMFSDLEQQLEDKFGLQEAVIVESDSTTSLNAVYKEIGIAAANYLRRTLENGDTIGVSWGATLNAMVSALQSCEVQDVHVVQIIGGLGAPEAETHATDLCKRISRLLSSRLTLIPASGIVDSLRVKQALLSDSHVQSAMELFKQIDVAYVGIGSLSPSGSVLRESAIINQSELDNLLKMGAVGDIALRFHDVCGRPIRSAIDERVVGISLEQLGNIERVVGVAGGSHKVDVVLGALRSGLIDVLITDQQLATRLLMSEPCAP